jgi:hypothetical protein
LELRHFTLWINSRRIALQRHRWSYDYPIANYTRRYKDAQRHRPIDKRSFVMHLQCRAKFEDIDKRNDEERILQRHGLGEDTQQGDRQWEYSVQA